MSDLNFPLQQLNDFFFVYKFFESKLETWKKEFPLLSKAELLLLTNERAQRQAEKVQLKIISEQDEEASAEQKSIFDKLQVLTARDEDFELDDKDLTICYKVFSHWYKGTDPIDQILNKVLESFSIEKINIDTKSFLNMSEASDSANLDFKYKNINFVLPLLIYKEIFTQ